ncbi:MAG: DUF3311 domain-containing protein [Enterobacteriaceae bacterium]
MKLIHLIAAVPFVGMLAPLPWVNSLTPFILGLPFVMFWFVLWIVLLSACLALVYKLDPNNRKDNDHE